METAGATDKPKMLQKVELSCLLYYRIFFISNRFGLKKVLDSDGGMLKSQVLSTVYLFSISSVSQRAQARETFAKRLGQNLARLWIRLSRHPILALLAIGRMPIHLLLAIHLLLTIHLLLAMHLLLAIGLLLAMGLAIGLLTIHLAISLLLPISLPIGLLLLGLAVTLAKGLARKALLAWSAIELLSWLAVPDKHGVESRPTTGLLGPCWGPCWSAERCKAETKTLGQHPSHGSTQSAPK